MRYTLYVASVGDDRHTAYSYVISNFEGIKKTGIFVASGKRRNDDSYCGHIALQRALREASKLEGVVTLRLNFDVALMPLAFELMEVESPIYPPLFKTTERLLKRFDRYEMASGEYADDNASYFEVRTLDDALDMLESARTIRGRWQLFCARFANPNKLIR